MNMKNFDPYVALGLAYGVTDAEIKTQYRKLVKQYHPDFNRDPNAKERMDEILRAYQMLSDPKQKAQFDQLREQQIFGQYRQDVKSTFFDGLKSFATRMANDFIDDMTNDMEEKSLDPNFLEICDFSSRSTRTSYDIKIRIPKNVVDIWQQDREYWMEQLFAHIEYELKHKI